MKALVFRAPERMGLETLPDPSCEAGALIIRVKAASVCGTDIRIYRGIKTRGVRAPSVLGHEFSGIIEESGDPAWRPGQRVAICPALACGTCPMCLADAANICESLVAYGYELDGGFAERVHVPRSFVAAGNVIAIPDHMSFEEAALAEPLACVINGQAQMGLDAGQHVAVLGAGPIGLLHVMLARARGARRITVVQRSKSRREAALMLGADTAITAEEAAELKVDAAIVAVGSADLANLAAGMVRPRGRINLFAGFSVGEMPRFDLNAVHYGEHQVTGAFGLTLAQFREAFRLIGSGEVPAGKLVTHRVALGEAMEAVALAARGEALKAVITG